MHFADLIMITLELYTQCMILSW